MNSQSELAYERIKNMIFHMELLPGDHVPELQIAAKLAISRTPIHDALRKLESEGLVTIGRNRGATVTEFADEQIKDIGTVRLVQDILAVQLAAYYGCASDFDRLIALADACEVAAAKGDIYLRIQKDIEFHLEISKLSGNEHLISQQYAIYQQIHLIQVSKYTDVEHSLIQIHHHKPLVAAIRNGDLQEAKKLSCQHITGFYKIDPYIISCYEGDRGDGSPDAGGKGD